MFSRGLPSVALVRRPVLRTPSILTKKHRNVPSRVAPFVSGLPESLLLQRRLVALTLWVCFGYVGAARWTKKSIVGTLTRCAKLNYRPGLRREGSHGAGTGSSKTASWRARVGHRKVGPYSALMQSPFPKLCVHMVALCFIYSLRLKNKTRAVFCVSTLRPNCHLVHLVI